MSASMFGDIMRHAVESTPGAIGGAFADPEGEMVDCWSTLEKHDWAVLTAHYGVVLAHLHNCYGTWHYGGLEYFIAQHAKLDIIVYAVAQGYYAVLALTEYQGSSPIALALTKLKAASIELRKEIV